MGQELYGNDECQISIARAHSSESRYFSKRTRRHHLPKPYRISFSWNVWRGSTPIYVDERKWKWKTRMSRKPGQKQSGPPVKRPSKALWKHEATSPTSEACISLEFTDDPVALTPSTPRPDLSKSLLDTMPALAIVEFTLHANRTVADARWGISAEIRRRLMLDSVTRWLLKENIIELPSREHYNYHLPIISEDQLHAALIRKKETNL